MWGARSASWGWFQGQCGEFPKQMLTHGRAEPTAHTSEGTAMSPQSVLLIVRPTSLKIPLNMSRCSQRKFDKEKM